MLLLDRILQHPEIDPQQKTDLERAVVLDCTPVADYFYRESDQERWYWTDFPNVAPPFAQFWTDFTAPTSITSREHGRLAWDMRKYPQQWGIFWMAQTITDPSAWTSFLAWMPRQVHWALEPARQAAYWGILAFFYWKMRTDPVLPDPYWFWMFPVNRDGGMILKPNSQDTYLIAGPAGDAGRLAFEGAVLQRGKEDAQTAFHNALAPYLHTGLLSLSFLHCKNIETREVHPLRKEVHNRVQKRRGVQPYQPVTYRTLNVHPVRTLLATEGQSRSVGAQRALHICRGNFAHYTPDKPLFGKVTGTFWRPMHVRGSKQDEAVDKRYHVFPQ